MWLNILIPLSYPVNPPLPPYKYSIVVSQKGTRHILTNSRLLDKSGWLLRYNHFVISLNVTLLLHITQGQFTPDYFYDHQFSPRSLNPYYFILTLFVATFCSTTLSRKKTIPNLSGTVGVKDSLLVDATFIPSLVAQTWLQTFVLIIVSTYSLYVHVSQEGPWENEL